MSMRARNGFSQLGGASAGADAGARGGRCESPAPVRLGGGDHERGDVLAPAADRAAALAVDERELAARPAEGGRRAVEGAVADHRTGEPVPVGVPADREHATAAGIRLAALERRRSDDRRDVRKVESTQFVDDARHAATVAVTGDRIARRVAAVRRRRARRARRRAGRRAVRSRGRSRCPRRRSRAGPRRSPRRGRARTGRRRSGRRRSARTARAARGPSSDSRRRTRVGSSRSSRARPTR